MKGGLRRKVKVISTEVLCETDQHFKGDSPEIESQRVRIECQDL